MKKLTDKLNKCFMNNGNARHIDYAKAEKVLKQFREEIRIDTIKHCKQYPQLMLNNPPEIILRHMQ